MNWNEELDRLISEDNFDQLRSLVADYTVSPEVLQSERCYLIGLTLLNYCIDHYSHERYINAIDMLIEAFEANFARNEVLEIIEEVICKANNHSLQQQYEQNRLILEEKYHLKLSWQFEDIPFVLLPVTNDVYRYYDKNRSSFLRKYEVNYQYHIYSLLQVSDINNLSEMEIECILALEKNKSVQQLLNKLNMGVPSNENNLAEIEQYHKLKPYCEKYYWFLGKYYIQQSRYVEAKKAVETGLLQRRLNSELCLLLAQINEKLEMFEASIRYYALVYKYGNLTDQNQIKNKMMDILNKLKNISEERLGIALRYLSRVESDIRLAPWGKICSVDNQNDIKADFWNYCNEYLDFSLNKFNYFVGIYNEASQNGMQAELIRVLKLNNRSEAWYIDNLYDIHRAKDSNMLVCSKEEAPYLIAIAPMEYEQTIDFLFSEGKKSIVLGKSEFNFFRIDQEVKIVSDKCFLFTKPILLGHKAERKKLVLNIFVDALSFAYLKKGNYQQMPNMMKFFQKGVIFNNNYSVAEWTYPSVAAMQTGVNLDRSQMFHPHANFKLNDELKTIAEKFNERGYYCVDIMESMENIYSDVCRGYDRIITNFVTRAYVGVERAIRHLNALREADVFMTLHFLDMHPLFNPDFQIDIETQAKLDLTDRFFKSSNKSAFMESSPLNILQYEEAARNVDRALGTLFAFLEENYQDDEILITLYSDHGVSIFENNEYLLSENHTATALMFRGKDVPQVGLVNDEITSSLDLYQIMAHLEGYELEKGFYDARLPKVFGGEGSEYVFSNSLYPGQSYKLCIRTRKYEFQLMTLSEVTQEGKVDGSRVLCWMYEKGNYQREIYNEKLKNEFLLIAYHHMRRINNMNDKMKIDEV